MDHPGTAERPLVFNHTLVNPALNPIYLILLLHHLYHEIYRNDVNLLDPVFVTLICTEIPGDQMCPIFSVYIPLKVGLRHNHRVYVPNYQSTFTYVHTGPIGLCD